MGESNGPFVLEAAEHKSMVKWKNEMDEKEMGGTEKTRMKRSAGMRCSYIIYV